VAVRHEAAVATTVPLVLDPHALAPSTLEELRRSLRQDLEETLELIDRPRGAVRDPASLVAAGELVRAAARVLDRPGPRTPEQGAEEANLAYAVLLAAIDLVKSHTDVPRVPAPRRTPPGGG
jgi:hypothetical protein